MRFGYWHFAFLGTESLWAAEASECAADQNAFWEYHDLLFANQAGENRGAFSIENLKRLAQELGLETEQFNECLDGGKYRNLVRSQTEIARQIGVNSTPSFLINGQPFVGAQPFENFQKLIEALLKESD